MEIRFAQPKDVTGILTLLRQVGDVHHQGRPDIFREGAQKYDAEALEAILRDPLLPIFVAAEGDFVAGYCFCQWKSFRENPVMTDRKELYVDDLCVDENRRGQKIASRLFDHVRAYAKAEGCDFLTLNVWCGNTGAMKFYENIGMKPRSITMDLALEEV